jgi:AraC family transcriptional regulator
MSMRQLPVPVTMGSPWSRVVDSMRCRVTEARFSAGDVLHAHTHNRPILAVMLSGSFDTAIMGKRHACLPGHAWTEPCEERHANYIGLAGARVVVMQPDPLADGFDHIGRFLDLVTNVRDPLVALDARRLLAEMDQQDRLSELSIDALVTSMLVRVARWRVKPDRAPAWLKGVRDVLHDEFRTPPSLAALSELAGITPTHLCHAFREHVGTTIGEYVRTIRATWAAEQLRTTSQPLSMIALAAGYSDQSHFNRECRRLLGARPSDYRRRLSAIE